MPQLLFYENAVPVSPQKHGDLSIDATDYSFAANVNTVPLSAVEMSSAATDYTIVFAGDGNSAGPVVILGLDNTENEYVKVDGTWNANYIPAFVRRYPFIFARKDDTFTLCVDENWDGCNREGRGKRLFDDDGERTEYLSTILKFMEDSQAQFLRTQAFCNRLMELDLLEAMKADFTFPGGERKSLRGFMSVSREKLKALAPEKIVAMLKTNELELIFAHLLSMNNFRQVVERSVKQAS